MIHVDLPLWDELSGFAGPGSTCLHHLQETANPSQLWNTIAPDPSFVFHRTLKIPERHFAGLGENLMGSVVERTMYSSSFYYKEKENISLSTRTKGLCLFSFCPLYQHESGRTLNHQSYSSYFIPTETWKIITHNSSTLCSSECWV